MSVEAAQADRLVRGVGERSVPALARAISLVENGRDGYEEILSALHPSVGNAHRIGITGPPGSGKSTLIERVVRIYRDRDITVAVVAVDPTSPFTGGALLGDRIRMESLTLDPGVYIRSMASRGATGGLATTTREVCDVLDAFGFERVIIETVGVGQSELAIAGSADTTALVLVPESGDGVQVLKAGVMEIADLYVINKSDRPGADRLVQEVEVMLGIRRGNAYRHVGPHHGGLAGRTARREPDDGAGTAGWAPPVLKTAAAKGEGTEAAIDAVDRHRAFLESTGLLQERRRARLAQHTREVVNRALSTLVWERWDGEAVLAAGLDDVVSGRLSPYRLARNIVADLQEERGHGG
ncbi:MAG: methylmalonyl Co-A mutase-associated GTPase MeaB [Gemmatimonadota bacterium]|nr:methylmalonyl Co-A mutase-associated GTPase MeaB [Gemmatimonadota bacterium]MDH3368831.1 methylmalonyl Co-A mutase-associated GTPase MeaB [Gemmatimonadota bacterium]MDH3478295.1 methylmalonyl Co-A mutase-associated GTPase MeaB [Gemmatimonadota bacterium]MDH3569540.1 methylmalonyl Co-A mutase-associated GTPase MeaB [Gemmatimonadota bacterium]MDH5550202.1 methylmalonyl Co-A mutase-associated GTPase MeaB [Gemmatimonadota bacterium]